MWRKIFWVAVVLFGYSSVRAMDKGIDIDLIAKASIQGCQWKFLATLLNEKSDPQPIINHLLNLSQEHLDRSIAHNNPLIMLSNLGNSLFAELLLQSIPTTTNTNPGSRQALKALIKARKILPFKSLGKHYLNCNNWTAHTREHRQELINVVNELKQELGFWGDILYPKLEMDTENEIVLTTSYKAWLLGGSVIVLVAAGIWWLTKKPESDSTDTHDDDTEQENNSEVQVDVASRL